jgi:hypothetical protein
MLSSINKSLLDVLCENQEQRAILQHRMSLHRQQMNLLHEQLDLLHITELNMVQHRIEIQEINARQGDKAVSATNPTTISIPVRG